ncbi:phytanoyl-CoA dioxygenase family protein [Luteimonas sp. RD2P54]|uniref:Phytanoyl-CoA dioxygenase family protein n=1 Tax=Luteimonas endophytica TaxID=3042023 RepID=A0ABT6J9S8_9GAMM|nr:phytanoyl-CoA dioxygenase family protein [Luteimonas endophytica]MDH5823575.1 phytanoyl-CoA dioxygenase family protein [Luteimonas endophytica]
MLNDDHARGFAAQGVLRLEGVLDKRQVAPLARRVLGEVKRLQAAASWRALRDLPVFQQIGRLSGQVAVPRLHQTLATTELLAAIAGLAGRKPSAVQPAQLLLSPPSQGEWTLRQLSWHVDVAATPGRLPGIQAFFLIDDVAPQGGATLALAGSHRVERSDASAVRQLLKRSTDPEPELAQRGLAIVEMSGRAGDVYLMDMRLLHTPSVNASRHPRMMATCRCLFAD